MFARLVVWTLGASLLSGAASGQDPVKAFPRNYSLSFENTDVAVIRVHYGAHEKVGVHDHSSYATVYVYLSDSGPVRFEHYEAKEFTQNRPPVTKGAYRVGPGIVERHTVENLGDISSDYYRVELKNVPAQALTAFRGPAPAPPLSTGTKVEYNVPYLQVERIVCAAPDKCPVEASTNASLLIAFDSLLESRGADSLPSKMEAGAVHWLPAGSAMTVQPDGDAPVHLLRLILTQSPAK
jgi:hypothetical protein